MWAVWTSSGVKNVVDTIDFVLGVISFIGAVIGLWLGYVELQKVKNAADAAKAATEDTRKRLLVHDAAAEITAALVSMKAVIEHLNDDRVRDALRFYDDARIALMRGMPGINITEPKLEEQAKSLDESMKKAEGVLRRHVVGIAAVTKVNSIDKATSIRDLIIRVQTHHLRENV